MLHGIAVCTAAVQVLFVSHRDMIPAVMILGTTSMKQMFLIEYITKLSRRQETIQEETCLRI